jgi:hypothetical protein
MNLQPKNIVKDNFLRSELSIDNSRPKSPNIKKWESYLDRKLTQKEKYLLINASNEIDLNKMIMDLALNLKNQDLYIPQLTFSDGNCLYESITYHIKDISIKELRKTLSNFMIIYKNYKNLFPNQELTLNEMFLMQNEIEYIYDKKTNNVYNYNYDTMCADLACDCSWQRLPVQIILMCISYIFDVKITICHDNGYTHDISTSDEINKTIYIGLLGEFHYIPLTAKTDADPDDITDNVMVYNKYVDKYHEWKKTINC